MKIRVGRQIKGDLVHTFYAQTWTAASWKLTGKSLEEELVDRAYTSAGLTRGPRYCYTICHYGKVENDPRNFSFEVKIHLLVWEEVE